jgi:hypothetical protein
LLSLKKYKYKKKIYIKKSKQYLELVLFYFDVKNKKDTQIIKITFDEKLTGL